jgi:hypothetical protein
MKYNTFAYFLAYMITFCYLKKNVLHLRRKFICSVPCEIIIIFV